MTHIRPTCSLVIIKPFLSQLVGHFASLTRRLSSRQVPATSPTTRVTRVWCGDPSAASEPPHERRGPSEATRGGPHPSSSSTSTVQCIVKAARESLARRVLHREAGEAKFGPETPIIRGAGWIRWVRGADREARVAVRCLSRRYRCNISPPNLTMKGQIAQ